MFRYKKHHRGIVYTNRLLNLECHQKGLSKMTQMIEHDLFYAEYHYLIVNFYIYRDSKIKMLGQNRINIYS